MCSFSYAAKGVHIFQVNASNGDRCSNLHRATPHSFTLAEGSSGLLEGVGMLTWS